MGLSTKWCHFQVENLVLQVFVEKYNVVVTGIKLTFYCCLGLHIHLICVIFKIYGGVYLEDQQWYRCRVKELIEEDKVSNSAHEK